MRRRSFLSSLAALPLVGRLMQTTKTVAIVSQPCETATVSLTAFTMLTPEEKDFLSGLGCRDGYVSHFDPRDSAHA